MLQKAIEKIKLTEGCGEKRISHAQKVMSDCAPKLSAKLDGEDDIEDPILRYFLRYLRYLDDLQSNVVAEEIQYLQKGVNLQDPALEMKYQDSDC